MRQGAVLAVGEKKSPRYSNKIDWGVFIIYGTWCIVYDRMDTEDYSSMYDTYGIMRIQHEVKELQKRVETLDQENKNLRAEISNMENRIVLWKKEYQEFVQLEIRGIKEVWKQEFLEGIDNWITSAKKKGSSLMEAFTNLIP